MDNFYKTGRYEIKDPASECRVVFESVYSALDCSFKIAIRFDDEVKAEVKSLDQLRDENSEAIANAYIPESRLPQFIACELLRLHVLNAHSDESWIELASR